TGLNADEALQRALNLRERLRSGTVSAERFPLEAESIETLHALAALLDQSADQDPKHLLDDASAAFAFVSDLVWSGEILGGREDLLTRLACLCWRSARRAENPAAEAKWRTTHFSIGRSSVRANADRIIGAVENLRSMPHSGLNLADPEQLLSLCNLLRDLTEVEPTRARDKAEFLYKFVETSRGSIGVFDEREYYLGEFAHIAGGAC